MCSCKSLVPPACSRMGSDAKSKQVHHHKNLLMVVTPLQGCCRCHCLHLTQPLGTGQPHILASSYFLPLQSDFLDFLNFSLVVWLVPLDPRQFFLAAAPCFHHNFDLVAIGIYHLCISSMPLSSMPFFPSGPCKLRESCSSTEFRVKSNTNFNIDLYHILTTI